jgi:Holliday junction resolvasome RuvABC endonuclease subunit
MKKFVILGVDPGLRHTGYAVADIDLERRSIGRVLTLGTIETLPLNLRTVRKTSDHLRRAQEHANRFHELVERHQVNAIAMELTTLTPYKHPTLSFGIMTGIVAALRRPVIEVLPKEVKKVVGPTKRDVIAWALTRTKHQRNLTWPTSSKSNALKLTYRGRNVTLDAEHPADALGAIEAALKTSYFDLAVRISTVTKVK